MKRDESILYILYIMMRKIRRNERHTKENWKFVPEKT